MSGRLEKEMQFENKCRRMLDAMPNIARLFYVYFKGSDSQRTNASCHAYLNGVRTYFKYLRFINVNPDDLDYYKNVKPADITAYIDQYRNEDGRRKSDSSVALMVNIIKSFYSFLEDNGYIERTPCGRIKAPKVSTRVKPVVMTREEIEKVRNYILYYDGTFYNNDTNEEYWRLRDHLIFTLGCRTGLRCSAIAAIDIGDIDFENKRLVVTEKGNDTKDVYFGDNTKELILEWIRARYYLLKGKQLNALFISNRRQRISSRAIEDLIQKYTEDIIPNKHITPHKMRSTCATNLWKETHDIYMVANQLGHRNLANTKRYTDISEDESRKVATILDEL